MRCLFIGLLVSVGLMAGVALPDLTFMSTQMRPITEAE